MSRSSWLSWTFSPSHARRAKRRNPAKTAPQRRHRFRPSPETLETRVTPSYGLSTLASFFAPNGSEPYASLIMDSSGNLYGTAYAGGASGDGTVFELAHGGGTLTTPASFHRTNGQSPECTLIMDSSGDLYGTTYGGGASSDGTVFELAQGGGTLTTLASFNGTDGQYPEAGVIMDNSGNLYGTTYRGGASSDGTVFELAQGSGTITTLASFNGTNGLYAESALIMDSSGNLYGTTHQGGASNEGTVFELAPGSGTLITLASFNGTNGEHPESALIMDDSGNLYGTTYGGGASGDGTVFEMAQGSGTLTTLALFSGANGQGPGGALIMDSSGNLYGTTWVGPGPGDGTVFELAQGSGTITTLASFLAPNGENPYAGLIMDSSGNVYGTTWNGGASSNGTVFEMAPGSGTITTLALFNGANGQGPGGALIMDGSGNLYGTTSEGGASNDGTVFELAHGSGAITTLASFNGANGDYPLGALVMDSSGNLYGTTDFGGASNDGTVFKLAHGSGTITTLASFNGTNGEGPHAGLIMDSSGNLYGTTVVGGACGYGSVFELAHGSGTITTLASFTPPNGSNPYEPYAPLIMDSSGNLYGTTGWGGAGGDGAVFELAHGSGTITTLASFNSTTGGLGYWAGGLVMDSSGNLYGTADYTVFELAHGSGTLTALASLNGSNEFGTEGSLIRDSSGNLYGTTWNGGAGGEGTVFVLTNGPWFAITGPTGVTAGTAGSFTLTALNANGTLNTGYSGTVQITSSDPKAVLPANLTISGGTGTFNVTLETAGAQSITATDVNNPSMTGLDTGVSVSPAAASQVVFTQTPSSGIAGQTLGAVQAAIEDAYGNLETADNSDTVTVSVNTGPSTQMGGTLTETAQAGVVLFSNLVLDTSGNYTLAALDNLTGGGTLGPFVSSSIAVASPVSLSFGSITYNKKTGLYSETVRLTNNTSGTLMGPMSLELTNLPSGVVLTDATGTTNGNPYICFLNSGKTLKKGASVSIALTFTAPSQSDITFGTEVVVGL